MITFKEARDIILKNAVKTGTEPVDLLNSLDRVLGENIVSDIDMPPFNKSAMDGYACKMADLKNPLEIIEIIPAGKFPELKITGGKCAKIMTGAPVPEGADCVIMIEDTEMQDNTTIRFTMDTTKPNIVPAGSDVKKGNLLISKGTLIKPQHIAILAGAGKNKVSVSVRPRIGVISTGDELVEPPFVPAASQIRNTNAWQLMAQAAKINIEVKYYGISRDHEDTLNTIIQQSVSENEITLLTGGVSKGDFDFVPQVLEKSGFKILFDSVNLQPGKPSTFAVRGNQVVFGLPGNPVSSFFQFELLVKPFIMEMMDLTEKNDFIKYEIGVDYQRKKSGRLSMVPVTIRDDGRVYPVEYHGSAHIGALRDANGIMAVPPETVLIKQGSMTDVRPI